MVKPSIDSSAASDYYWDGQNNRLCRNYSSLRRRRRTDIADWNRARSWSSSRCLKGWPCTEALSAACCYYVVWGKAMRVVNHQAVAAKAMAVAMLNSFSYLLQLASWTDNEPVSRKWATRWVHLTAGWLPNNSRWWYLD